MSSPREVIAGGMKPFFLPHQTFPRTQPILDGVGAADFQRWPPVNVRYPTIFVTEEVLERMQCYTDLATTEIGWFVDVEKLPSGDYLLYKVFLFKQDVHASQNRMITDGMAEFAMEMLNRGEEGIKAISDLRCWVHSHVFWETDPSERDLTQMLQFGQRGIGGGKKMPWFIMGIVNKKGRMTFTLYDFERGVKIVDLPWQLVKERPAALAAEVADEFGSKIRQVVVPHNDDPTWEEMLERYRPKPAPVPAVPPQIPADPKAGEIVVVTVPETPATRRARTRAWLVALWRRVWPARKPAAEATKPPDSPPKAS